MSYISMDAPAIVPDEHDTITMAAALFVTSGDYSIAIEQYPRVGLVVRRDGVEVFSALLSGGVVEMRGDFQELGRAFQATGELLCRDADSARGAQCGVGGAPFF